MLRFLLKTSFFLMVPIGIMCLNFVQNPGLLFRGSGVEEAMIDDLLQGRQITVNAPFNLRTLRNSYIKKDSKQGNVALFGGSTIMELGDRYFDSTTLKNYAVLEPSIEDMLALYHTYGTKGKRSEKMLLAVNPYLFYESGPSQDRWIPLKSDFIQALKSLDQSTFAASFNCNASHAKALLSVENFRKAVRKAFRKNGPLQASTGLRTHLYPDGSWDRMSVAHAHNQATFDPRLSPNASIDPKRIDLVLTWLEHAKNTHEEVFLLFTPYSPSYYATSLKENPKSIELEDRLRKRAETLDVVVIGSFNPDLLELGPADFIDQVHWTSDALSKYMSAINFPNVSFNSNETAPSY